jgi:hypothetical protein
MGINAAIAVDFVGAGSPKFIPPTNNLHKPAPNPNRVCFGAGFYDLSVVVKDVGEPAPIDRVLI